VNSSNDSLCIGEDVEDQAVLSRYKVGGTSGGSGRRDTHFHRMGILTKIGTFVCKLFQEY